MGLGGTVGGGEGLPELADLPSLSGDLWPPTLAAMKLRQGWGTQIHCRVRKNKGCANRHGECSVLYIFSGELHGIHLIKAMS